MNGLDTASYALVLAGVPALLLAGVLAGVWLGFRIVTRDAALLANVQRDSREARALAEGLSLRVDDALDAAERKRAQASAAAQRAEQREAKLAAAELVAGGSSPAEPEPMTLRDRRRLIGRRVAGRA